MMKAVQLKDFGAPENMYIGEVEIPKPQKGEILLQVKASAINRADTLQRKGAYPAPPGASTILGLEAAGVVTQLGEGASKWKVGDKIMCLLAGGGNAEFVAVPEVQCMPVPASYDFDKAAAIPETWLTGFQLLHLIANVKSGDYVLIHAGASGVGTGLIQMCNLVGAKAIVTAGSTEKLAYCTKVGAKFAVNYKEGDFSTPIKDFVATDSNGAKSGVDIVLDCVGASHAAQNIDVLGSDSRWVVYGLMGGPQLDSFSLGLLLRKRIQLTGTTLRARPLDYKAHLVSEFSSKVLPHFGTKINPEVDIVLGLSEIVQAHKRMEANLNSGKIVLSHSKL